eukprot:1161053-Pelagomonas_calceolata.AAC.3
MGITRVTVPLKSSTTFTTQTQPPISPCSHHARCCMTYKESNAAIYRTYTMSFSKGNVFKGVQDDCRHLRTSTIRGHAGIRVITKLNFP